MLLPSDKKQEQDKDVLLLSFLFNILLEILVKAIKQEKINKWKSFKFEEQ